MYLTEIRSEKVIEDRLIIDIQCNKRKKNIFLVAGGGGSL